MLPTIVVTVLPTIVASLASLLYLRELNIQPSRAGGPTNTMVIWGQTDGRFFFWGDPHPKINSMSMSVLGDQLLSAGGVKCFFQRAGLQLGILSRVMSECGREPTGSQLPSWWFGLVWFGLVWKLGGSFPFLNGVQSPLSTN